MNSVWWDLLKIMVPAVLGFVLGRFTKRLDRRLDRKDAAANRAPSFELRHISGQRYLLVNTGDAQATGVLLDLCGHPENLTRDVPCDITMPPGAGHAMFLGGSMQRQLPAQLLVKCDQLDSPPPVLTS